MSPSGDFSGAGGRGAVDLSGLVARRNSAPGAPAGPGGAPAGSAGGGEAEVPPTVPSLVLTVDEPTLSQLVELSLVVPVVLVLDRSGPGAGGEAVAGLIERAVTSLEGRMLMGRVDVTAQPAIAQAFGVQAVPTVAAIIAGRPTPLFQGSLPERELLGVLQQVLDFAAQNGVAGSVAVSAEAASEPAAPQVPPLYQEAYDAIERGDYEAAMAAYRKALAQNPRDEDAAAGLAQVGLLSRLAGADAAAVRAAAAQAPADVAAQLAVADLDLAGGHVEDAFGRLLDAFPDADEEGREQLRTRILDFFAIVGPTDPRVLAARRRLANLLY